MIRLIINADDFGQSKIFNEKILDLLERGIVKSTTVMVSRIDESQKNQFGRLIKLASSGKISVGLHLEFDINLPLKIQIKNQYEKFISLFGFKPSHLDIHKQISNSDVISAVNRFAEEKKLPVRNHGIKANTKQTTRPAFFCKNWVLNEEVKPYLERLKDGETCEIITHPGDYDPNVKSAINKERLSDYNNLIKLHEWLKTRKNIKVISYKEL